MKNTTLKVKPGNLISFVNQESYLSLKDKKKLTNYLRLLRTKKERASFKEYLQSCFALHQGTLLNLFNHLESKVYVEHNRPIRLGDLTQSVYGSSDIAKCRRKFREDVGKLADELIRFRGITHGLSKEAEINRLQVEAIKNEGHLSVYNESLERWNSAAAQLPLGSQAAYHKWAAADAGYFANDIKKNDKKHGTFVEAITSFHDFTHHYYLHYENERFTRTTLFGEDLIPDGGNELLTIQYLLTCLHRSEGVQSDLFDQLKAKYAAAINLMSVEWALIILVLIQNYLIRMKRLGAWEFYRQEASALSYFFLNEPVFKNQKSIAKSTFLNQLHNAIDAKDENLRAQIFKALGPKLPPQIRETTLIVANIGLFFDQEKFETVIREVKKTDYQKWKDKYIDFLRLKSYRLRSAIFLYNGDITYSEEAQLAYDDFNHYAKENLKKAKLPVAKINEVTVFLKLSRKVITAINGHKLVGKKNELIEFCNQHPSFHSRNWMISFLEQAGPR